MNKFIIIIIALILSGCGDEVSWSTQEEARGIARENSEYNAKAFRKNNAAFHGWNLYLRGDSTIGKNCASGDGWASVDLEHPEGNQNESLKCHTAPTKGLFG